MVNDEYKRCPYCGEDIKAIAIKCKHCKSDLAEGGPEADDLTAEVVSAAEPVVSVAYKCPKCSALIQEGVTICGNCKAQLVWKDGKPKLSAGYAMQQTGCALTSIGCLLPILIVIIAFIALLIAL